MILVNAPVACENSAHRGPQVATEMQEGFNLFRYRWGYAMSFGVGIPMGPAVVGTNGYEGPIDYTAIANVVNLASRLGCGADDTQILVDAIVAKQVKQAVAPVSFGERTIKGYDHRLQVFAVERSDVAIRYDWLDGGCRD
jgi:adenylate cyclase